MHFIPAENNGVPRRLASRHRGPLHQGADDAELAAGGIRIEVGHSLLCSTKPEPFNQFIVLSPSFDSKYPKKPARPSAPKLF